jgi:hypothetical protein
MELIAGGVDLALHFRGEGGTIHVKLTLLCMLSTLCVFYVIFTLAG